MDSSAHNALIASVLGQQQYCDELVMRAIATAPYLNAEQSSYWDAIFLATFYGQSLRTLLPVIETARMALPWTTRLCSSVVDDAVPGRGLLAQTLFVAVDAGLIIDASDALQFRELLYGPLETTECCLVAYIDYVGSGADFNWLEFQPVWNSMHAEAVSLGIIGYYWRSSDTYYFVRSVKGMNNIQQTLVCDRFLDFLLWVQNYHCINRLLKNPDAKVRTGQSRHGVC